MIRIHWKWVILATIIFLVFLIFVLPQMAIYSNETSEKLELPDTLLIYSGSNLYDMAESYGELGRETYIKQRWTFDLVWPFVYTLFLVLWIVKLLEYISVDRRLRWIYTLPVISMFFDFMENIGVTIVMARYPMNSGIIATITPFMTLIKWVTISGTLLVLIILVLLNIFKKMNASKINSNNCR